MSFWTGFRGRAMVVGSAGWVLGSLLGGVAQAQSSVADLLITGDRYQAPDGGVEETLIAEGPDFVPPSSLAGTGLVSTVNLISPSTTPVIRSLLVRTDRPVDPQTGAVLGPTQIDTLAREDFFLPGFGLGTSVQSLSNVERIPIGNASGQVVALGGSFDFFDPPPTSGAELLGIYRFDAGPGNGFGNAVTVARTGQVATDALGQPLPGGERWAEPTGGNSTRMQPRFNDAGEVFFAASLVAPGAEVPGATQRADAGLYLVPAPTSGSPDPDPRLVLRQDQSLPALMDALLVNQPRRFERILRNDPGATFEARANLQSWVSAHPALDPSGRAVMPVNAIVTHTNDPEVEGGESLLFAVTSLVSTQRTGDPANPVDVRLLVAPEDPLTETQGAPGPGWIVLPLARAVSVNGNGQTLYEGNAISADRTDLRNGLFVHGIDPNDPDNRAADTNTVVVLDHDEIPHRSLPNVSTVPPGSGIYGSVGKRAITGPGDVVARIGLRDPDDLRRVSSSGLLLKRADEASPTLLLVRGQTIATADSTRTVRDFERIGAANSAGDLAITLRTAESGGRDLFLYEREQDRVVPVLLTGDTLELPVNFGEGISIDAYEVLDLRLGDEATFNDREAISNGLDGRPRYLDDDLRMAVWVFLRSQIDGAERGAILELTYDPLPISGDFDGNGFVAQGDLNLILSNWGEPVENLGASIDPRMFIGGVVDQRELNAVLTNWGNQGPAVDISGSGLRVSSVRWDEASAVPEPGVLGVALAAGGLGLRRRR